MAIYDLVKKASVRDNAVLPVLMIATCFGAIAYVAGLASSGKLIESIAVDRGILLVSIIKSIIVGTSWILTYCALRKLPVTIATPIRANAPALVIVLALILYSERPTLSQWLGMLLVFSGFLAFSWAGKAEGIDFLRNRSVWFAVGGMVMSAISSLWDKYVFQVAAYPVESVQLLFQIGLFTFYVVIFSLRKLARIQGDRFEWRWSIPWVGVILALADWLYFHGLAIPEAPISVGSLLRRFSVVITFVLGAIIFHEHNLRRKGLALSLIVIGTLIIAIN